MKKKLIGIGSLFLILSLIIGGTYAYWTWNSSYNKNIVFSTAGINEYIIYDEGESYFVGNYQPYVNFCESVHTTISIKKTSDASNMDLRASIKMDINEIGDNIRVSDNVYYVVTSGDSNITCSDGLSTSSVIASGTFKGVSSEQTLDLVNNIEVTIEEEKYTIWIWIDASGDDLSSLSLEKLDTNIWMQVGMIEGSSTGANDDDVNVVVNDGMIPVIISDDGSVLTIDKEDDSWYDYTEQKWANAILVTNSSRSNYLNTTGIKVNQSDILGYFVWIPRYKYRIWTKGVSSTGKEKTIDIIFESKDTSKSNGTKVGEYLTHPAFTFGTEELDGFWVGKFETTGTGDSPTVLPNVQSLRSQNVSTQFQTALKFSGGTLLNGAVYFNGNSTYGLTNETNSHMMKNSEWGAVAYLSHSIYGINTEVRINNNNNYITGCGASTANENTTSNCEIVYGNASEYPQSTTGNITGIYDMSGGASEYVMGNYNNTAGSSGFSTFPKRKYYDLYLSSQFVGNYSINNIYCTINTCGGHAIYETASWYSDYSYFVDSSGSWLERGGSHDNGYSAGMFNSNDSNGSVYVDGSFRSVLTKTEYTTYYSVSYDANGGSNAPSMQVINEDNPSVSISNVIPTKEGYRFLNWNTAQDGSGITYRAGDTYNNNSNITLYAQWTDASYTLSIAKGTGISSIYYKVNGASNYISSSSNVSVSVASGTTYYYYGVASTGYTLSSCTSSSPCSGTVGTSDISKSLSAAINTYTLSIAKGTGISSIYYKVNGASNYTSSSSNVSVSVNYNTTYYYYGVASTGYTLSSCTSSSPCSGTVGTSDISKNLSAAINTYTVTYNANGGSGAPSSQTKTYGVTLTLSSTIPTRSGYTFLGWSTSSSATSATYSAGGSFTTNANTTLYAVWQQSSYTLSITKGTGVSKIYYKVNGASSYTSSSSNVSVSVTSGTTYYYYGTASSGYTMSSCTASTPCSGTMGTSAVSKSLTAKITMGSYLINNKSSISNLSTSLTGGLYRYQGTTTNVTNNYICFGTSTKSTCTGTPGTYMYRIIGVDTDGNVKVIKNTALSTQYAWHATAVNKLWNASDLYTGLNGSYFLTNTSYVPSGWSSKIASMTWYQYTWSTGITGLIGLTGPNLYLAERNENSSYTVSVGTFTGQVSLMKGSDYYLSLSDTAICSNKEACTTSWMWLPNSQSDLVTDTKSTEWTMDPFQSQNGGYYAYGVTVYAGGGHFTTAYGSYFNTRYVRPVFYISSSVSKVSGTGTASDPYIIS